MPTLQDYSAEKIEAGYNLITEKIGDDGKPDCHGVLKESPDPDNEKLGFFFVSLSEDKQYMRFYFSGKHYFVYRRKAASGVE